MHRKRPAHLREADHRGQRIEPSRWSGGEIMIEDLSGVAVDVEYASEYCYRSTMRRWIHRHVVTQSGETATPSPRNVRPSPRREDHCGLQRGQRHDSREATRH